MSGISDIELKDEQKILVLNDVSLPGWGEQLMYATRLKNLLDKYGDDNIYWNGHPNIQRLIEEIFNLKNSEDVPDGSHIKIQAKKLLESYEDKKDYPLPDSFKNKTDKYKNRYWRDENTKLVGISFSSYTSSSTDPSPNTEKSIPIESWEPIFDAMQKKNCRFISLQYGHGYTKTKKDIEFLRQLLGDKFMADPTVNLDGDQRIPAQQMMSMDAVVSVSNSSAHLAGFMGTKTLVIRRKRSGGKQAHWEKVDGSGNSAYYPSIKVITQENEGWGESIEKTIKWLEGII